jgi:hypothetical protein
MNEYLVNYDPDSGKWYYFDGTTNREVNPSYVMLNKGTGDYFIDSRVPLETAFQISNSTGGVLDSELESGSSSYINGVTRFKTIEEAVAKYPYPQYEIRQGQRAGSGESYYYPMPNYDYLSGQNQQGSTVADQIALYNATTGQQQTLDRRQSAENLAVQQKQAQAELALKQKELLADLQANPRDWIEAWYLQNSMKSKPRNILQEGENKLNSLATDKANNPILNQYSSGYATNPDYNPSQVETLLSAYDNAQRSAEQAIAEELANPTYVKPKATAPKVPDWLAQYAPGVGNKNNELTKVEVPTLSGQQYSALDPSKLAGLAGYMDWANTYSRGGSTTGGENYEDMVANMKRMLPENPVGAGNESWRTVKQRR